MTLMALTFLAFAISDDRDKTHCMDDTIVQYCRKSGIIDKLLPKAMGIYREQSLVIKEKLIVNYESVGTMAGAFI